MASIPLAISRASTFHHLDDDVLLELVSYLHWFNLANLSTTCRRMRIICIPALFSTASIRAQCLSSRTVNALPEQARFCVRTLRLNGFFDRPYPESGLTRLPPAPKRVTEDIESRAAANLSTIIHSMPHLETVIIDSPYRFYRWLGRNPPTVGVPFDVLMVILRASDIRQMIVNRILYHEDDFIPETPHLPLHIPRIKSFRYVLPTYREGTRAYDAEAAVLKLIIPPLGGSVTTLHLPTENAPFHEMSLCEWPALQELALEGEHLALAGVTPTPYISFLARMPHLRRLRLHIADVHRAPMSPLLSAIESPPAIWPTSAPSMSKPPLQALEELTVSHPRVDDQLWGQLPPSLRNVRLRSWPYHRSLEHLGEGRNFPLAGTTLCWSSPHVPSSKLSHIITSYRESCNVTKLELEYHTNDKESTLLETVAAAFPALQRLTLSRNDDHKGTKAAWADIIDVAEALRGLHDLCSVRMFIGWNKEREIGLGAFDGAPAEVQTEAASMREQEPDVAIWCLELIARVFVRVLGPAIEFVDLAYPGTEWCWIRFRPNDLDMRMREERLVPWW
ncbi:uncharacterized protein BXZ73DRAFT_80087 [Epithele typhae]|uniref:uncharacterized protein n=1 Tax=Epithele typhae TaxID=378194 RepID=UPI002008CB1F|nr:uncharacterized protein BXZ73DRAFT_80087 [Epithele typhae]KAH9920503.1 hypothetical protein BXZ73DRAFT_80087 [Epithele typhae]